jgi:hypothetical protein
MPVEIPID